MKTKKTICVANPGFHFDSWLGEIIAQAIASNINIAFTEMLIKQKVSSIHLMLMMG